MSLPPPPASLPSDPKRVELPSGNRLVRIYNPRRGEWPARRAFGPLSKARFDHHLPPAGSRSDRSVWYAATSLRGAVAEAFGKLGFVDRNCGHRIAMVRAVGPIIVLDLLGAAVRSVNLTHEIAATTDYPLCQSYARAFYHQYPTIQGIRWRGREIGSVSVVLNDRADFRRLSLSADLEIAHQSTWPRIARAARNCRLDVI